VVGRLGPVLGRPGGVLGPPSPPGPVPVGAPSGPTPVGGPSGPTLTDGSSGPTLVDGSSGLALLDRPVELSVSGAVKVDADLGRFPASTELPPLSLAPGPGGAARVARFGVNTVQVSVSDGSSERASAASVFLLGSGMPQQPEVTIAAIEHGPDGLDVAAEHVLLRSTSTSPVDMNGWTLRNLAGDEYRFPPFTLPPSAEVRVFTGEGIDGPDQLFWGRRAPVWGDRGASAILTDATGQEVARRVSSERQRRRPA
jgi:hypothetical protein